MEILTTKDLHSQLNTWMIHEILLGDVFFGLADAAAEFLAATDGGTFFILQVDLGIGVITHVLTSVLTIY